MRELGLVLIAFFGLAALAFGLRYLAQPAVFEAAWLLMTGLGAVAVIAEALYFWGLFVSLRRNGQVPRRWYARSFDHHGRLNVTQRRVVLPWFYLGFLGLVGACTIAVLLVLAAIGLFQGA